VEAKRIEKQAKIKYTSKVMTEIPKPAPIETGKGNKLEITGKLKMERLHEINLMSLETPDGDDNFFPKQYNNKPIQIRYSFK
jgi:hypothetical protein